MILTEFKDGILTVTCLKLEPTLGIVTVDDSILTFRFESGIGSIKARVFWEPEVLKAVGISYQPVVKAEKKLTQGQRKSPPKGYPKDRSQYAVPEFYEYPIDRKHIHAAISYFPKHSFRADEHKAQAAKRIMAAAKRYGVHVSPDSDVARAAKG